MKRCRHAKDYKGTRKYRCNGGVGCDECRRIWQETCNHPAVSLECKKFEKAALSPLDIVTTEHWICCNSCDKKLVEATNSPVNIRLFGIVQQLMNRIDDLEYQVESLSEQVDSLECR